MSRKSVVARAYCSSANLGSGFDVFSLSLEKYSDIVKVELWRKSGIVIKATGPFGRVVPRDPRRNSAGPPAAELMRRAGTNSGLKITIIKNVPPAWAWAAAGPQQLDAPKP